MKWELKENKKEQNILMSPPRAHPRRRRPHGCCPQHHCQGVVLVCSLSSPHLIVVFAYVFCWRCRRSRYRCPCRHRPRRHRPRLRCQPTLIKDHGHGRGHGRGLGHVQGRSQRARAAVPRACRGRRTSDQRLPRLLRWREGVGRKGHGQDVSETS